MSKQSGQVKYIHHRDYGLWPRHHSKLDESNLGEHQAYCERCKRIVVWVPVKGPLEKK